MTALHARGRRLLTEDAAAAEAGVDVEMFRNWVAWELLPPATDTPAGPRHALHDVRAFLEDAWQPPERPPELLTPQQVSLILHVGVRTITQRAVEGRFTCHRTHSGGRRYVASEIRAIAAERERLGDPQWWPDPKTD
jgi:hypothetical protein